MGKILDRVNLPEDVRKLDPKESKELAKEIREFLVENVSKTGGHLSPNLGVVELTLADGSIVGIAVVVHRTVAV